MRNLSDQEIIDSVRKGNESDYSIIINRYKNKAFSMLTRMLKNEFDAEEVLQDCFLKAYNSLSSFKGEAKFSTWFYRIVYNSALTKLSSQKRKIEAEMTSVEDHFNLVSEYNSVDIEKKDINELVHKIINKLPEKYSAIITMFYLNEMSIEEISEVMQITASNVKVMLHRSRNLLRDLVLKSKLSEELI
ncbi:MAG: sigma-70 family RNA polymerase sigma factor [Ignavibacteriaceae bacterium]|nr:sigma-70 family RNA polymerase sigma factor [Ignavibacteriaceae bacterium]